MKTLRKSESVWRRQEGEQCEGWPCQTPSGAPRALVSWPRLCFGCGWGTRLPVPTPCPRLFQQHNTGGDGWQKPARAQLRSWGLGLAPPGATLGQRWMATVRNAPVPHCLGTDNSGSRGCTWVTSGGTTQLPDLSNAPSHGFSSFPDPCYPSRLLLGSLPREHPCFGLCFWG